MAENALYYGDNLDVLKRYVKDESVDLVYLDPPFNSNANYSVLFGHADGTQSAAQIQAFEDTWRWDQAASAAFQESVVKGGHVASALSAFQTLLGPSTMLAYLSMMAPRLVELHRVLKPTGSLYLHCDPTAGSYLRILLDAVFGPKQLRNEITWKRTSAHSDTKQGMKRYGRIRDLLLFYTKTDSYTWNPLYTPYSDKYAEGDYRHIDPKSGRAYKEADVTAARPGGDTSYEWHVKRATTKDARWEADLDDERKTPQSGYEYLAVTPYHGRYWAYSKDNMKEFAQTGKLIHRKTGMPRLMLFSDEMPGVSLQDLWDDISPVAGGEALGYPTQKPEVLLERVISASSNPGDLVLDPFCGCGTTIAVAQKLKRNWIGIDLTALAISLIKSRLTAAGASDYKVLGEPTTVDDAQELARTDPYGFQWWALGLIGARPAEGKKGADHGIDGRLFFFDDDASPKQVIVSVKAGNVNVSHVRDLLGVLDREKAQIGVCISLNEATQPMRGEAASAGFYISSLFGDFPRIQLLTVADLLGGKTIQMPQSGGPQGMMVALPPTPEEVHPDQLTLS